MKENKETTSYGGRYRPVQTFLCAQDAGTLETSTNNGDDVCLLLLFLSLRINDASKYFSKTVKKTRD